jgi:uncharacterized protein (TIGR03435 family)
MRILPVFILGVLPLLAQLPPGVPSDLRFEAASLKVSSADLRANDLVHIMPGGERYEATNSTVRQMLQVAFRIRSEQFAGIPGWLDAERFDMQAKAEKPSSPDELHVMLVNMLRDRMGLRYHIEKREMPIYALVLSSEGAKLTRRESSAGDSSVTPHSNNLQTKLTGINARMDFLAFRLSNDELDRPVVDMTGLKGTYDFEVNYTRQLRLDFPSGGKIDGEDPDTRGPNIFTAFKQQLGLELRAQKGSVEIVVVDHAERLEGN